MKQDSFRDYVLDQFAGLGGVRARAMFGGHGFYLGAKFFGILFRERLYFRVDERSRGDYERRGMEPFRPPRGQTMRRYYEVPAEVVEDAEALAEWARRAAAAVKSVTRVAGRRRVMVRAGGGAAPGRRRSRGR